MSDRDNDAISGGAEPVASLGEREGRLRTAALPHNIVQPWAQERIAVELPVFLDLLAATLHAEAATLKRAVEGALVPLPHVQGQGKPDEGT